MVKYAAVGNMPRTKRQDQTDMSLVIAENITHAYGALIVLRNMSFRLSQGDRIGLIGPNGEGKTTLLNIVAGALEPTEGKVHRTSGLTTGYLPQDPPALTGSTIDDAMLNVFASLRNMEQDMHKMADRMAAGGDNDEKLIEDYGNMQTMFEDLGGYDYHTRIEQVLTGLKFPMEMRRQPIAELSGGQRTRAYLATLLLKSPTLLMLDEPTNHLDLDTIEWLESWLGSFKGTLVVVSHDRYFLDNVTTSTWEVAAATLEPYSGSYSQYLPKKAHRIKEKMRTWRNQQDYIRKTEEFIRIHLAGQRTKEAQGRRSHLQRFMRDEAIDRPREDNTIHLKLTPAKRTGNDVLTARDLAAGYDDTPLVTAEDLRVERGQRIAIVGANGAGKTTLLRTLLKQLPAIAGTLSYGTHVELGYLSQTHAELAPDSTLVDAITSAVPGCTTPEARDALGSMLFTGDDGMKKICELSGGQRSRVVLTQLTVQNANVLALDEPTNHLDIPSTEIMQEALQNFPETLLFVSHDRYLIQAVATDVWAIRDGQVKTLAGGWETYLKWRSDCATEDASAAASNQEKPKEDRIRQHKDARKQANLMQRLKRRHEELETQIDSVEQAIAQLNDKVSAAGEAGNLKLIDSLSKDYQSKEDQLKQLWDEWEHIGEQLE